MLLLAACGKSAQVPLQSWLGDAMEGPTPVSALIHAATMVTAGVYLIVRSADIFNAAPDAQTVVVVVGAVTLLFGAIVGCAKDDIKKALAGSTMSQIGYMILAASTGPIGYVFAIMHLVTHGFFKAGLFLGAGSVMHGMNDEVDMRRYGGLRKYMPVTFVTFGLGYLAIIGFPGLSGFFSKDMIIEAAFAKGGTQGWILGSVTLLGAAITAYYMTRVMIMTFFGEKRWQADEKNELPHPHESPKSMTVPMILLAFGSVFAGGFFSIGDRFVHWLEPVTGYAHGHPPISAAAVTTATVAVMVIGVGVAYLQYGRRPVPVVAPRGSLLTRAARRDLLQDDFNHAVFVRGGTHLTRSLVYVDHSLVDGVVNGTAASVGGLSGQAAQAPERLRPLVRGLHVRRYCGADRRDPADEGGVTVHVRNQRRLPAPYRDGCGSGGRCDPHRRRPRRPPHRRQMAGAAGLPRHPGARRRRLRTVRARRRAVPADRVPRLDQGLRRPLRTRRRRHRGGAHRAHRPADPLRHPGKLARRRPLETTSKRWRPTQGFFALILMVEAMVILSFEATDVFLFYILFEAMLIPMYFLIGGFGDRAHAGSDENAAAQRSYAAVKFLLYNLVSGLIMLAAVIGLYVVAGNFSLTEIAAARADGSLEMATDTERLLFLGFFFAFAVKAPLWPLHTWLPNAMGRPPPRSPSSSPPSSTRSAPSRCSASASGSSPRPRSGPPPRSSSSPSSASCTGRCSRSASGTSSAWWRTRRSRTSASSSWASSR